MAIKRELDQIKIKNNDQFKKEQHEKEDHNHGNDDSDGPSAKHQIRNNMYQNRLRKFQTVMQQYNESAHSFKKELEKRTRREIMIVDPNITDEKMDEIIESGKASDVIKQALISDNLQDVIRVIEERHLDILNLERGVLEIHELWKELSKLVDLQQESLDNIENHINNSKNYVEKGEVEIQEAEDYQKKARQRRCCMLMVLLGVLIVVLAPTLASTIGRV